MLLERAENNLFEIDRELCHRWVGAVVRPVLADVCDARRMAQVFAAERPQVVFHCAAHKHVPIMEMNPGEAIRNNIFGTRTIADAAARAEVQAFVMVSTDKAVNPTSVMGASKRVAELYVQSLNQVSGFRVQGSEGAKTLPLTKHRARSDDAAFPRPFTSAIPEPRTPNPRITRFVAVRFGNVLGSSGSVVPIFQRQIDAGGPVTVTHPDMCRYFMTIPEASQLVMNAGAIGQGGEIFVLDMGQPIRILDLARELIRRNGLRPERDIAIRFTGIRAGEKLFEELALADEQTLRTSHAQIRVWQLTPADPQRLASDLDMLAAAAEGSVEDAIAALASCVPEYHPASRSTPPAPMRLVTDQAA